MDETSEQHDENTNVTSIDSVRQRALEALAPIISDLGEVEPEKKFEICISALRYTADATLANSALEAALAIQNSGIKAEALVELINELNYIQLK